MDLIVKSKHLAVWNGHEFRCAVGRNGFATAQDKKEGDGATPIGRWIVRDVFYRPDREKPPATVLPVRRLQPNDGWCDSPRHPEYNRHIVIPFKESAECLWREDPLYDIIAVLGYNDDPVVPGKGSAIFLHIAKPDFSPSAGCIHLSREDLLTVLREADRGSAVLVSPST
ncbi:MAG: L,D-transpeptidase family protein [Bdellovibrionales bacterium]